MRWLRARLGSIGAGCLVGIVGAAGVTAALSLASLSVNVLSLAVCYQLLVLVVSGAFGAGAGLATSAVSVAAFNWFFVPPVHTFTISDSRNWVAFVVFAATAVITSQLAGGARRQREEAEARRRDADLLSEVARSALVDIGLHGHPEGVAAAAARALGVERCRTVLSDEEAATSGPRAITPSRAGFGIPLVVSSRPVGILEVGPALPGQDPRWRRPGFAATVGALVSLAVERGQLLRQALEAESLRRSDELKTALIRTVSHEFRTPLTAMRTAGAALAGHPADAEVLVEVICEEGERLDRLVSNLLDLSRTEAGAMPARLDWCDAGELVSSAVRAARPLLGGAPVEIEPEPGLPLVRADAVFCERIIVNLLHNAVRHGAPPVRLHARVAGARLEVAVTDAGGGPDPAVAPRLFSPFASGGRTGGTGVGLALSRRLAEAQGGSLSLDRAPGRTRFVLALPLSPVPEVVEG